MRGPLLLSLALRRPRLRLPRGTRLRRRGPLLSLVLGWPRLWLLPCRGPPKLLLLPRLRVPLGKRLRAPRVHVRLLRDLALYHGLMRLVVVVLGANGNLLVWRARIAVA